MDVFFTTVIRQASPSEGGEVVKLDWDSKKVLAVQPIVPTDPPVSATNTRGGTRGGRGILIPNGNVIVASYHSLHSFDLDLSPQRRISNHTFANLHEICNQDHSIWATSTEIDAAVQVDKEGKTLETWWPRDDAVTAQRFGLTPLKIDKDADNRTAHEELGSGDPSHVHINAVAIAPDGRPLMLLNRFGAVIKLHPTEVFIVKPNMRGCHNLLVTKSGHLMVSNTLQRSVDIFDQQGTLHKRIMLEDLAPVARILRRLTWTRIKCWLAKHGRPHKLFHSMFLHAVSSRPVFVRGLCETPNGNILVGISPAAIIELDWKSGKLVDFFSYSDDVNVCVHGMACK